VSKPTTGKYSIKPYECQNCGHEFETGTNHWGEIYDCPNCRSFGFPNGQPVAKCKEVCPDEYDVPPKWRMVKLSEVIKKNSLLPRDHLEND